MHRATTLTLGPLLGVVAGLGAALAGLSPAGAWTAGITAWTAAWWITEAIPIPAASLLPFVLFPLCGVLDHEEVGRAYGHTMILLLLGGFMLSTALERCNAHRRLAVAMLRLVGGTSGRRIVLGFMLASGLVSMWISNTATVLMLLPVAMAVLEDDAQNELGPPLLLGTAYAASIGGMGTPVGTAPNVICMGVYEKVTGQTIGFAEWMAFGVPVVVVLLPLTWWLLVRRMGPTPVRLVLPELGPWTPAEKRVLLVFAFTSVAWVTRTAPFGGWAAWTGITDAGDSTVALGAVVLLFLVPNGTGSALLDWKTASQIPWSLLLLFGGGIAIAEAFSVSGLSEAIGDFLANELRIAAWPVVAMTLAICVSVTFLTEVTSNTAITALLTPILAAAALSAGVEPKLLLVPATLSASCAFMLPVGTPPNAIVFGTERVTMKEMIRAGLALNVAGAVALTGLCVLLL